MTVEILSHSPVRMSQVDNIRIYPRFFLHISVLHCDLIHPDHWYRGLLPGQHPHLLTNQTCHLVRSLVRCCIFSWPFLRISVFLVDPALM